MMRHVVERRSLKKDDQDDCTAAGLHRPAADLWTAVPAAHTGVRVRLGLRGGSRVDPGRPACTFEKTMMAREISRHQRDWSEKRLSAWESEGGALGFDTPREQGATCSAEERSLAMMGAMLALFPELPNDLRLKLYSDLYGLALASRA